MKRIKSPCVRDLKRYDKKGCPEKPWDKVDQEGCPCWVSLPIADPVNASKVKLHWACVDLIAHHQRHAMLQKLEGNHAVMESFRNGMVEETTSGPRPKSDVGTIKLVNLIDRAQRQIDTT